MSKNVTIIPPSQSKPDILRVAAHCRVSSDSSDQLHSYASQIRNTIQSIPTRLSLNGKPLRECRL